MLANALQGSFCYESSGPGVPAASGSSFSTKRGEYDIHESCDLEMLGIVTRNTFFHGCVCELTYGRCNHLAKASLSALVALVRPSANIKCVGVQKMVSTPMNSWMLRMSTYVRFSVVRGFSADTASNKLRQSVTCNC